MNFWLTFIQTLPTISLPAVSKAKVAIEELEALINRT